MTVIVMVANLFGVDMFAKIQNLVAFLLVGSMVVMGIIGALGLGTGQVVSQPASMSTNFFDIVSTTAWHSGCLLEPNMSFQYPKMLKMPNEMCRLV